MRLVNGGMKMIKKREESGGGEVWGRTRGE